MRIIRINSIRMTSVKTKVFPLIPTLMFVVRQDMKSLVFGFYKWLIVLYERDITNHLSGQGK